ncbi:PEP-CTERM sorting domain-containing protein [Kaarinaea lacus]
MEFRALIVAFLALLISTPSYAVYINGELTTTDAIGVDADLGSFYYDLFYVTVDTAMTIEVFMDPVDPFAPYIAYWDGDFSATPDWDTPPPLDAAGIGNVALIYMAFDATPGVNYQVMATTYNYNPTDLGSYNLFIVNPERDDTGINVSTSPIASVPEPASWLMLGFGLLGLGFVKRQRELFAS